MTTQDGKIKMCLLFIALFLLFTCVVGGAQVPSGRLQHAGVDLCRGRGAGYRRGGPHCLLRCTEESHPPGAANGTYWTQAAGTNRRHPGWGARGEGECVYKSNNEMSHEPSNDLINRPRIHKTTYTKLCFSSDLQPEPEQQAQRVQVHYRQQKRVPHVPQQSPHAARGGEPHPA